MKKSQSKLKPHVWRKNYEIKLQMNEHEISIQVKNNSRLQIVQPQFTTWKYKVK